METNIYLDFEMNKYRDGPCEIIALGAIKVVDGQIVDRFHSLVALRKSDEVCVYVSILTGIKTLDLEKAKTFNYVWETFSHWCKDYPLYCWGNYDKSSLIYTGKVNKGFNPDISMCSIHRFVDRIIDLEKELGYDQIYKKQSLRDIVLSLNQDYVIETKRVHHPTYDAELLFELHKQVKKPNN